MSTRAGVIANARGDRSRPAATALSVLLRNAPPVAALLSAAALLALAARVPPAFEDGYHHWLIAAGFATTGRVHDPLFGMEDSWLAGYHVVAGTALWIFGSGQIELLRALSAAFAIATMALLFQIAGSRRRGVIAVLALALNPIFLLTATSVVVEPLLTLLLTAALAALLAGRRQAAAVLGLAACLVGTKAWLWLLVLGFSQVVLAVTSGRLGGDRSRRLAVAWLLPALLVAAGIELTLAPAGHSLTRAATEAAAGVARGSVVAAASNRGINFLGYFALASLPLVVLAPLGVLVESRQAAGRSRLRLLHAPAAGYLAGVVALVVAGAYTGSHRYLYPALPALALLAAAALDRARVGGLLGAGAGAGLVAIAFIPVLQGFGALDDGLIRAGRAASAVPGGLLTDSPAAAYSSGKAPGSITGSRSLPSDPDRAVAWLRANGITSIVVEDISYYRINRVFPGLAAGRAVPPFRLLGAPGAYAVPGGKTVTAYTLSGDPRFVRDAPGVGKTARLARGASVESAGRALNGEGLGFGVPILRYPDGDWFAGTAQRIDLGTPGHSSWRVIFAMDRRGVDDDRSFAPSPERGRIAVTYSVEGQVLAVEVEPVWITPGFSEVVLLNEQSARFDDFADAIQTRLGDAVGSWTPVAGEWGRFRSQSLGLEWSLPALPGAALYAAREIRLPDIDFSGLEYSFGPGFSGTRYAITLAEAR